MHHGLLPPLPLLRCDPPGADLRELLLAMLQPPDWTEHLDEQQNQFFFNSATEQSSYAHPYDVHYQKLYKLLSEIP
jgi:hypothetical protein